jgi:DNA uptake protein ComE-like DNA-binding protein
MLKPFAISAALAVSVCLFGHPASALTQPNTVLAQATQTPPAAPKMPPANPSKSTGQAPAAQAPTAQGLVDINSASEADLQTLSGIGPARAKAIIAGRPYNGKDDLVNKSIIPSNVYDGIKDKIIAKKK